MTHLRRFLPRSPITRLIVDLSSALAVQVYIKSLIGGTPLAHQLQVGLQAVLKLAFLLLRHLDGHGLKRLVLGVLRADLALWGPRHLDAQELGFLGVLLQPKLGALMVSNLDLGDHELALVLLLTSLLLALLRRSLQQIYGSVLSRRPFMLF